MASPLRPQPAHLGSDGDQRNSMLDERKMKRMMLERLSVRRSLMIKQQQLNELLGQINQLQNDNNAMMQKIGGATQMVVGVSSENSVLRARFMELSDRLQSLNEVLYFVLEDSGPATDVPEIPDTLLKPWQLPCLLQPITTSTNMNMFQY